MRISKYLYLITGFIVVVAIACLFWTLLPENSVDTEVGDYIVKGPADAAPVMLQEKPAVLFVGGQSTISVLQHADKANQYEAGLAWSVHKPESAGKKELVDITSYGYNNVALYGTSAGKAYIKYREKGKKHGLSYVTESIREVYVIPVKMELLTASEVVYAGDEVVYQYYYKPAGEWTQEGYCYEVNGECYVIPAEQFSQQDFEALWAETSEALLHTAVTFECLLPVDDRRATVYTDRPGEYSVICTVQGTDIRASAPLTVE